MHSPWTVAIGASGGEGLQDLCDLLSEWSRLDAVVMIVLHRPWDEVSHLQEVLQRSTPIPVIIASEVEHLRSGQVYIGEPASHLTLIARTLGAVSPDPAGIYHNRTVDLLFNSLAAFGGPCIIGIVLANSLDDGSRGLAAIKKAGGRTMVVTPGRSRPSMPESAITYVGWVDVTGDIQVLARAVEDAISIDQPLIS